MHYCTRCMPDADTRQRRALCPRCSKAMRYLGAATEVVPFWQRVGAFFRYPFHTDPLIVIAICTLVPLIAPPNLIGLLIWIVLALALFKYTYAVINHTAEGHLKPPPVAVAFTGSGFNIVILQLLVFVLMGGLVGAAAMIGGPILMMLALAFAVLALPASIMVLAMERSVGAAVNPMNLAVLISRIGTPYFLLYGYLILLTLASGAAQDFAVNHFPMWVAQPLAGFLNSTRSEERRVGKSVERGGRHTRCGRDWSSDVCSSDLMERSVGAAVNPMNLAVLISRIGTPYFLLYGYLILLTLASGAAQDFAVNHFPMWVAQPLAGFLNSTFTLILFHMLGYLLFQYQEELGFASDIQDEISETDQHQRDRSSRFDADLDMNLKDGNYDRVQSMLKEALKRDRTNSTRIGQLYQLLTARNDAEELYRYHPRIMAWLADAHRVIPVIFQGFQQH